MDTFIQLGDIKLIKSDNKDIPNKCCSFKLYIYQIILKEMYHSTQ